MFALLNRFKKVVAVIVIVMVPLLLILNRDRAANSFNRFSGAMIDLAGFFQGGLVSFSGAMSDRIYRYVQMFTSHEELLSLRLGSQQMLAMDIALKESELENEQLRKMANMVPKISGDLPIGASVIARSGAPLTRLIRINVGRKEGVKRGDGVFGLKGVIGQVLVAGKNASDVLLLSDTSSAMDVMNQRTRARGILRGMQDASYQLQVEDFDRLEDIRVGDVVVSAGDGSYFPKGIPVGIITIVDKQKDAMYNRAEIKPFVDFSRIEQVYVLADESKQSRFKAWGY